MARILVLAFLCLHVASIPNRPPSPAKHWNLKNIRRSKFDFLRKVDHDWNVCAIATTLSAVVLNLCLSPCFAADSAQLFENNCAACHPGGSNVIGYARSKTLKVILTSQPRISALVTAHAGRPRLSKPMVSATTILSWHY